jgi:class 3 adenylate cyclase/predicted ATPase
MRCNACQCDNPTGARYCTQCGAALTSGDTPSAPRVGDPAVVPARIPATPMGGLERRAVTIMFCDLVGSTALSGRLDPEDLGTVLLAYREAVTDTVRRFGGFVARYVGDSLLVYFGYPLAHDDDAVRAVQAAMQIRLDLEQLGVRLAGLIGGPMSVHIGIHTGEVIAGEFGSGALREEAAVVGETPNIAARLQAIAGPDEVVVSLATWRLAQRRFEFEALPQLELKGVVLPQSAYRVVAERAAAGAAERWEHAGDGDLLGREEEIGLLAKRWLRVADGDGQVALVSGEAGIGKTRLLQALVARIGGDAGANVACQCSPYFTNTAFFPFVDLVRRQLKLGAQPTQGDFEAALAAALDARKAAARDALPLVAAMLAGVAPPDAATSDRSPQAQRDQFMEWLVDWLVGTGRPLILVVEDLHWADASTLDFLQLLVDQIAALPVFLLLSFRSEFRPPWPIRSNMSHLTLGRLASGDVRAIVGRLTEGRALPPAILAQVVEKTDGVPLFVEEFTKMVIEAGLLDTAAAGTASAARAIDVPDTLRGSLLARLDRQGDAKVVAQVAAVIDREISFRLLEAVCGLADDALKPRLARLVDAELLLQRGMPPESHYTFKHSLIRDAAYQSLLKSSRAVYHRRTAEALLAQFPALADGHPEFVAHHFSEAGQAEEAFVHWRAAGMRALEASANVEASAHLARALRELAALAASPAAAGREVELQIALGTALTATRGYGASEVEATYARAYALCETLGDPQQLFAALSGLHTFYQVRGPLAKARDVALRLVRLAERSRDESQLAQAHRRHGWSLFCSGRMREGKIELDRALALYDATRSTAHAIVYGAHPWIVGFVNSAWLEWVVGHPGVALERSHKAIDLARALGRPLPLAYALCMSAAMHQCDGDPQQTLELAAGTVALARENSMPYWVAWGSVLEGWALVQVGQFDTGMKTLESGLHAYRETGAELFRAHSLCLLGEAFRAQGRVGDALDQLQEALASAERQEVHFYTAEIHRLRGDLLLDVGRGQEAALACYRESMALANAQGALAFELRAAASLSALLLRMGQRDEAVRIARELGQRVPGDLASADVQRVADIAAGTAR